MKCPSRAGTSLILKKKELKHVISSISKKKGFGAGTKAGEIVSWLKEDFELGHGYAMAMVHAILNGSNIGGGFAYREWNAVTTLARGFARGGAWTIGGNSGVSALSVYNAYNSTNAPLGFRVTK